MSRDKSTAGSTQDSKLAFRESYLKRLLPVLVDIHEQGSRLTTRDRLRAIKFAADMALAMTAGGVSWSRALSKQLSLQLRGSKTTCDGSCRFGRHTLSHIRATCKRRGPDLRKCERSSGVALKRGSAADMQACRKQLFLTRFRRRRSLVRHHQNLTWKRAYLRALRSCAPRATRERRAPPQPEAVVSDYQITSLREIIPGGGEMDAPILLDEAADYIVSLQMQVEALESLAEAVCN